MFLEFRHFRARNTPRHKSRDYERISVPRIPLSAILSFAIVGFGGALFLSYSFFDTDDRWQVVARPKGNAPVYSARAVPLDSQSAGLAGQGSGEEGWATGSDGVGSENDSTRASSLLFSSARGQLIAVDSFSEFRAHSSAVGLSVAKSAAPRLHKHAHRAVTSRNMRRVASRRFLHHRNVTLIERWSRSLLRAVFHPRRHHNQRLAEQKSARSPSSRVRSPRTSG
jgi:hypothetical protein